MAKRSKQFDRRPPRIVYSHCRIDSLEKRLLLAAGLLKDVNQTAADSFPDRFTAVEHDVFFTARDSETGRELWKTNTTTGQTELVKDILPGPGSSNPQELLHVGGTLYFTAIVESGQKQLWRSDGTGAGTIAVADINSSSQAALTEMNGKVYFIGSPGGVTGLWASDGVPQMAQLVRQIPTGSALLVNIGSMLLFSTSTGLWRSDGTSAGTFRISSVKPEPVAAGGADYAPINNQVLFQGDDGTGNAVWISDGTAGGTVKLLSLTPAWLTPFGDRVLFWARDTTDGWQLWGSDGTTPGTELIADPLAAMDNGSVPGIEATDEAAYFVLHYPQFNVELWKTDESPGGTVRVKTVGPPPARYNGVPPVAVGNVVYFQANELSGGELWRSDGTDEGTTIVRQITPPSSKVLFYFMQMGGGKLFFGANDGIHGTELWWSDGTEPGTELLADLRSGTNPSSPREAVALGNRLFFNADDGVHGDDIWFTDGTPSGTSAVVERFPPPDGDPRVQNLAVYKNMVLYAYADSWNLGGDTVAYLWAADSTGTRLIASVGAGPMVEANGIMFFGGYTSATAELWRTDGTTAGTKLVRDSSNGGPFDPENLVEVDGTLFFTKGLNHHELWKSDGTSAGTVVVKDFALLGTRSLVDMNGKLFFTGRDPNSTKTELWRSDGTTAGTEIVSVGGAATAGFNPGSLLNVNGTLFFSGRSQSSGTELYKSDGTDSGTVLVADIFPGAAGSFPQLVGQMDGVVYFLATHPDYGRELWRSDGTAAGTQLVKDIVPGSTGSSFPAPLLFSPGYAGIFYFRADDGVHGAELWQSDGTTEGTVLAADVYPGAWSSAPFPFGAFAAFNGDFYFAATDPVWSTELFRLPLSGRAASAGGVYRAVEGSSYVKLHGSSSSSGTLVYEWDLDGDGIFGETGASAERGDEVGQNPRMQLMGLAPHSQLSIPLRITNEDGVVGTDTATLQMLPPPTPGPVVRDAAVLFDTTPQKLRIVFDRNVSGTIGLEDIALVNVDGGGVPSLTMQPYGTDGTNVTSFTMNTPVADGNYRVTVSAIGVTDPLTGDPMAADYTFDFFILAADANHDRKVDVLDLVLLANNWLGTGKTFGQGDFNYDGVVNQVDLGILATRWQVKLDTPVEPAPAQPVSVARRSPARAPTRVAESILR